VTGVIYEEIVVLKREIDVFLKQVRCPQCNKLLAVQRDDKLIIRCSRCKHDTTVDIK